jgi:hypothetical protein
LRRPMVEYAIENQLNGEAPMATFEVPCKCGAPLRVSASQAGTDAYCLCGRTIQIPRLSDLQKTLSETEPGDDQPVRRFGFIVITIGVMASLVLVSYWNLQSLAFLAFALMFFGGKLWFLGVMFREMGALAILAFIIPFFDWLFLFKRFDVAWKPILLQFVGIVYLFIGVVAQRS